MAMARAMRRGRAKERGFALVMVLAGIAVMMILMGAGVSTWRYIMQDDREQELFFRGDQIARGVEAYQKKNGYTFPPTLDVMVKGKYLRRAYKDPMTPDGKWRLIRPGEAVPVAGTGGAPGTLGASPRPRATPSPSPSSAFGNPGNTGNTGNTGGMGTSVGVIAGVASRSTETSLRPFNGRTRYDQWTFLAGQPRKLGPDKTPKPAAGGLPGTRGASPPPSAIPSR
jgi:type II secretory pathway pseudopilin PulG